MKWEKHTPYKGVKPPADGHYLGQMANVYLNEDKTLIKRKYNHVGVTVNDEPSKHSRDAIAERWAREYRWLNEFNGMHFMPELIDIDFDGGWSIQRYYGPDLLTQGTSEIPNVSEKTLEIYKFFKEKNVYKKNGSLSNMTHDNGRLIAFDYKWMVTRDNPNPVHKQYEEYSIDTWLVRIDPSLVPKLKALL